MIWLSSTRWLKQLVMSRQEQSSRPRSEICMTQSRSSWLKMSMTGSSSKTRWVILAGSRMMVMMMTDAHWETIRQAKKASWSYPGGLFAICLCHLQGGGIEDASSIIVHSCGDVLHQVHLHWIIFQFLQCSAHRLNSTCHPCGQNIHKHDKHSH